MSAAVKLTVVTGPHNRVRYCFREKTRCLIGRGADCKVQLAGHQKDSEISRHHCELHIDPPQLWIHDLGSTNGTFVNGKAVLPDHDSPIVPETTSRSELKDGDVLTIGGTTLQVNVIDCPYSLGNTANPANTENICDSRDDTEDVTCCEGDCLRASKAEVLPDGLTVFWQT